MTFIGFFLVFASIGCAIFGVLFDIDELWMVAMVLVVMALLFGTKPVEADGGPNVDKHVTSLFAG